MADPDFFALPIDGSEGFPQAFRLSLGGQTYQFRLSASVAEEALLAAGGKPITLPASQAYLVLSVGREEPGTLVTILHRKLVPGLVYQAAELALTFPTMVLDPRNLNGAGAFATQVVGGVAQR
jgi:hypothetical protein